MPKTVPKPKLTIRQRKFVANKVAGKTNAQAYVDAGYAVTSRPVAEVNASRLLKNANIQQAIEAALEMHGATPEFAVGRIKQIAEQTDEIGAARLAAKDILELHGWRKGEQPGITLNVKNAFFGESRNRKNTEVIEGETA